MLVYLGGPIDMVSAEFSKEWREIAEELLHDNGVSCYNPKAAFSIPKIDGSLVDAVVGINNKALELSDVGIFLMGPVHNSVGTPMELMKMNGDNKYTIVIWDDPNMAIVPGMKESLPIYVQKYADVIVFSLKDATDRVISMLIGSSGCSGC